MTVHKIASDCKPDPPTKSATKWSRLPIAVSNVRPIDKPGSALKALCDLDLGPIHIADCKLIHAAGKAPWVAGPSYRAPAGDRYINPVAWTDKAYGDLITAAVLAAL